MTGLNDKFVCDFGKSWVQTLAKYEKSVLHLTPKLISEIPSETYSIAQYDSTSKSTQDSLSPKKSE
jgi:hypothetical protein